MNPLQVIIGNMKLERLDIKVPIHDDRALRLNALEILRTLKPDWHPSEITFKDFTVGITNRIFAVFASEDEETSENRDATKRLIFRVFGNNTEKIIDRETELRNWLLLSNAHLAAPLVATFKNGIVCGYLEGESLNVDSVRSPKIVRKICKAVARMHKIKPTTQDSETVYTSKSAKFLDNLPARFEDPEKERRFQEYFGVKDLRKEYHDLLKIIEGQKNEVVFCHNDLLVYNILYDKQTNDLNFIDYEYAGPNYQLFDIANHFNEYAGVDDADYSRLPSVEDQKTFLNLYLKEFHEGNVADSDVDELLRLVPLFQAASNHFWAIWSLVQAHNSTIDFDYVGYAILRHQMSQKNLAEAKKLLEV
ncbi:hypothetical protein L596_004166 [Steinernema carpocapsae]|uniref:ethanolamine kinase n=1 Tax=Steinernema carpocapsae TaxID=34508 RepID=A0A4U8UYG7_STECR|nr:hypothetical protein L596_004166 [Steinernema carpocapsae]